MTTSEFDGRAFRRALGNFATGVTIITAKGSDGEKVGVTASSFNSLSLEPPLILWSSIKESRSCTIFESASHFAVNILAADQMDMSNHFARQQEDKFDGIEWEEGVGGAPVFPGCAGRFQCETYEKVDGGDHWIFIGKVVAFDDFGRSPLCFHQGSYSMVVTHPGAAKKEEQAAAHAAHQGRLGQNVYYLMLQAVRAYQSNYLPKQEALGLSTSEARSVLVLSDNPGINVEGLHGISNIPQRELSEALANLADRGLVSSSGENHSLTENGRAKADEFWNLADSHAAEVFKDLSDDALSGFKEVLRGIVKSA